MTKATVRKSSKAGKRDSYKGLPAKEQRRILDTVIQFRKDEAEEKKKASEKGKQQRMGPLINPDQLTKKHKLIGHSLDETVDEVNGILCVVADAMSHDAHLEGTAQGVDTILRLVRNALDAQVEHINRNSRMI